MKMNRKDYLDRDMEVYLYMKDNIRLSWATASYVHHLTWPQTCTTPNTGRQKVCTRPLINPVVQGRQGETHLRGNKESQLVEGPGRVTNGLARPRRPAV
jgi:hypothetical protein